MIDSTVMSTFLKVILGIALVVVAAIVMLVFAVRILSRNIRVQEAGNEGQKTVNIDTPFGHVTVHENDQLDPGKIGIPIYPGAVRSKEKGGVDFQYDAGDLHKDLTASGAGYFTDDDAAKVEDFYNQKFPSWNKRWSNNGEYEMESKEDGHFRVIGIKRENGHTRIGVASIGAPAAN